MRGGNTLLFPPSYFIIKMENEIKEKEVTKKVLAIHCPECDKEIIGSTESQIRYNLKIHFEAKHGK